MKINTRSGVLRRSRQPDVTVGTSPTRRRSVRRPAPPSSARWRSPGSRVT